MNILFCALAVFIFHVVPAHADDGSAYQQEVDGAVHHSGAGCWACSTHSNGYKVKVIMAKDLEQAQNVAVDYCDRNGGSYRECVRNLNCAFETSHHPGQQPEELKPFYDWASGVNGYGYCYQFDGMGQVMNNGKAVANFMCDMSRTYYRMGTSSKGVSACYEWTPDGHVLNDGQVLDPVYCGFPGLKASPKLENF